jgi:2-dehydro-3-deoxyphosphooctonate aldolase (KDO 8-P synthase)
MKKMIIIAGPCVIESSENVLRIAKELEFLQKDKNIDFYFKASFDKANRTSLDSFRGLGIKKGLSILKKVKKEFGYKLLTDVHESIQVKDVAKVVDVLQIPAFLCRQTDLLVACAKSNCIVNIKKGQFLSSDAMKHPVVKVLKTRDTNEISYKISKKNKVWLTERGNIFGYGSLIVDYKNLLAMRAYAPVIFDATHSAQVPSSNTTTGGNASIVPSLAKAAAAVGVDGFFFETHFDPSVALSDGPNMLNIQQLKDTILQIKKIQKVLN